MKIGSFAKAAASLAAFTMAASPAFASVQSRHAPQVAPAAALPGDVAQDRGWGGGWGNRGWGRRHYDDGVSAGDVLAGVLVIGTIAAIASAASKGSKDKREREERARREQDDSWRYGDESRDNGPAYSGRSASLDTAVDTCAAEVDRGTSRVDTVDAVNREGDGWRVEGRTRTGAPWNCTIDGSGRIKGFSVETAQPLRN
jgi:hypothetical protein